VRTSIVDPYRQFLSDTLEEFPEICASRLYDMIRKKGYSGVSAGHLRKLISQMRPKKQPEAFFRLAMLPGEQAQVDWAEAPPADFGVVQFGKHQRRLSAFVMTLSYSRMIFLKFFFGMKMARRPRESLNRVTLKLLSFLVEFQEQFFMII
jgi:transposase